MDKAELDAIRAKVADEPEDSPARLLLAEIDRRDALSNQQALATIRAHLREREHLTEEEVDRVMTAVNTRGFQMLEFEQGTCRACKGRGTVDEPGCIGFRHDRCRKCNGRRTTYRIKVPDVQKEEVAESAE